MDLTELERLVKTNKLEDVQNNNRKIGYALGGGAAKGFFHIGVLSVLEEYRIFPDIIAGTSMGSIIGALYASGLKAAEMKQMAIQIDWKKLMRLTDFTLPYNGLIQGKRIDDLLKSIIGNRTFSDLKTEFACVATDLRTGSQVVICEGLLIDAIRASISIPGIFTPKKIKGRYLVDGGLVNVVPVSVCRDMGADFVIGVNVISGQEMDIAPPVDSSIQMSSNVIQKSRAQSKTQFSNVMGSRNLYFRLRSNDIENGIKRFLRYRQPKLFGLVTKAPPFSTMYGRNPLSDSPNFIDVLTQSFNIIEHNIAMENIKQADFAVSPLVKNIGTWQFYKAAEAILAGEQTTRLLLAKNKITQNDSG